MQRKLLTILFACLLVLTARADQEAKGDSIYEQLEETTKAKERIESDLRIARDIQMSMLPSEFPRCDRLDIYGTMTPAKQVGDDLTMLCLCCYA